MTDRNDELKRLLGPTGPDIGCEECFERLDEYVELELRGADPAERFPGTAIHLRVCPGCRADHDGVLEAARRFGDAEPE